MSKIKARTIYPLDGEDSTQLLSAIIGLDGEEATIASGSIAIVKGRHTVDTEGDAASDNLDTIEAGIDGQVVVLQAENIARVVTVRHAQDNIMLAGGSNMALNEADDTLMLMYNETTTNWVELSRSSIS